MSSFIYDIKLGFLAFPIVALFLALPYALWQYRRFGAVSIWKTFVVFTFILYCLCAVSLVVFPLPPDRTALVEATQTPQLHPFFFVDQIRELTDFSLGDRSTWGPSLRSPVVYEAVFNIMLTMPLGAYLCYLFRCRWWQALLIGIATTLLFETSQLTGLFGIYAHPYRLFDVDDLILNTTGTMLGFWLTIPLAWMLLGMDEVDAHSREKGAVRVTLPRRMLAMLADLAILAGVFCLAWLLLSPSDVQIAKALVIDPSRTGAKTLAFRFIGGLLADPATALFAVFLIGAVLFALIPSISKGRTIGNAIVGIRLVSADGNNAPAWSYWLRYLITAFFCLVPLGMIALVPNEIEGVNGSTLSQIIALVFLVWALTIVVRAIGSAAGYPYASLADLISGTRLMPSNHVAEPAHGIQSDNVHNIQTGNADSIRAANAYSYQPAEPAPGVSSPRSTDDRHRSSTTERPVRNANYPQTQELPISSAIDDSHKTQNDQGKQEALDSLLTVNYDEQHAPPNKIGQHRT